MKNKFLLLTLVSTLFSSNFISTLKMNAAYADNKTYTCNKTSDETVLRQIISQMQFKQKSIDDGSADINHTRAEILKELTKLQLTKSEIEDCFIDRSEAVPEFSKNYNRDPSASPSPTVTTAVTNQVQILVDLINSMQKDINALEEAKKRTMLPPLYRKPNGEIFDLKTGLTQGEIDKKIETTKNEISDLELTIKNITAGYNQQNFACEAVCDHEEDRMKALIADTRCNDIPQCKDCRTAFLSTLTTTGENGGITGGGKLGIIGDSCSGYRQAKSSSKINWVIGDHWRGTSNLCAALGFFPFIGGAICFTDMMDTAKKAQNLLGDWQKENSELLQKVAIVLKEMSANQTFSDYSSITRVSFWQGAGSIVSSIIGAIISNNKANDAYGFARDTEATAKTVCDFISKYSQDSAKNNANVLACTVYAGYLMTKGDPSVGGLGNGNGNTKTKPNAVNDIKDEYSSSTCGKLTGSICRDIEKMIGPVGSENYTQLSQTISNISKNPKKAAALSDISNTLSNLNPTATLGEKFAAVSPGLSGASISTLNELEGSLKKFVSDHQIGQENTASTGAAHSGSASNSASTSAETSDKGLVNQQFLVFSGKGGTRSISQSSDFSSTSNSNVNADGISEDPNRSLFKIVNDCTLRKQKTSEVALYSPLLQKNGGAFSATNSSEAGEKIERNFASKNAAEHTPPHPEKINPNHIVDKTSTKKSNTTRKSKKSLTKGLQ